MPRKPTQPARLVINGTEFVFPERALDGFPEAPAFLEELLADRGTAKRRVAEHTAKVYVTYVARLRRQGKLNHPELVTNITAHTAARAYQRFVSERRSRAYQLMAVAFPALDKNHYTWLRISSCVGVYPGKTVPPARGWHNTAPDRTAIDRATGAITYLDPLPWEPCDVPTLHVPQTTAIPVHTDPCESCRVIRLSQDQVETVLRVIELIHGHRNMTALAPSTFLFGEPIDNADYKQQALRVVRVTGLSDYDRATAALLHDAKAVIEKDTDNFFRSLATGPDAVYLSRAMCINRRDDVMRAVDAWIAQYRNV